ncbi:hypothetical protein BIW22_24865 [Salmonella enterica]|nr:hypothetical protein [Salmonella enterica]
MSILKRNPDQVGLFAQESKLATSDATEWVVIHSYIPDNETERCCVSPPMLALKWEMAQVVFNSLLEESVMNTARKHGDAFICQFNDDPDVLRLGVFKEYGHHVQPEEVMMLMDRRALTDELYFEMYLKDGPGDTVVMEMPVRPEAAPIVH